MCASFERKKIRLPTERYRGKGLYLVTLCFEGRRRFGSNNRIALWLIECLRRHADSSEFYIHAYCIMPDHMHLLAAGATDNSDLTAFVASFKNETGFEFEKKAGRRLWQFKYYDRILRGNDSADRVAWYIWLNPVRKGLCRAPREYPFAGSFTEIGKRMFNASAAEEWSPPWKREKVSN